MPGKIQLRLTVLIYGADSGQHTDGLLESHELAQSWIPVVASLQETLKQRPGVFPAKQRFHFSRA
jgi:hypothetical protein